MAGEIKETGFQLHDVRIVVLSWPEDDLDDLDDVLSTLAGEFIANEGWAEIDDGERSMVIWRGYITGGLPAAYLAMCSVIERHDCSILLSDQSIDLAAASNNDDVVVTGLYTFPRTLPAEDFAALCTRAMNPQELRHLLASYPWRDQPHRSGDSPRPSLQELESQDDMWGRSRQIAQVAPGQIDWRYLSESYCRVVEDYDPDGLLIETGAHFNCGLIITEVVPPAFSPTFVPNGLVFRWRAFQYDEEGGDAAVATEFITAAKARDVVPGPSESWVRERTRDAVEQAESYVAEYTDEDDVEDVRRDLKNLRAELRELDAAT